MSEDLGNKELKGQKLEEKSEEKTEKKPTQKKSTQKKSTQKKSTQKKSTQKKSTQKKSSDAKVETITAKYKYKPKENEKLITDKPSTPLKKIKKEVKKPEQIKTNGQIYEAYVRELKEFKLVYNGDVIYDSSLSKSVETLKFEADYFVLFGKKYSYNGLRIQKI